MKKTILCVGMGLTASVLFSPLALSQTFRVTGAGTAVITLTNDADNLLITGGAAGEVFFTLNEGEEQILTGVRNITVNALRGGDTIALQGVDVERDVRVRTRGNDADEMTITGSIGRNLIVETNGGDDNVYLGNQMGPLIVAGSTAIRTTTGDDTVSVYNLVSAGAFSVFTGSGNDTVKLEEGELDFIVGTQLNSTARIGTGNGVDNVVVRGITVERQARLTTDGGDDVLELSDNRFNNDVLVVLGGGNDEMTSQANVIAGRTIYDGSSGNLDTLIQDDQTPEDAITRNFEFFDEVEDGFAIGDTGPGGGIVFSVSEDGMSGLEAAPEDQTSAQWCNSNTDIPEVENLGFDLTISDPNSGAVNTPLIIDICGNLSAAGVAAAYEWPNGETDGFLPNREELNLLFNQQNVVGNFDNVNGYWSSSEFDASFARLQIFNDGFQGVTRKPNALFVRAVRAF